MLHLLHICLFGCAVTRTDALVVPCLQGIAILKGSKKWLFLRRLRFLREGDIGAIGGEIDLERASLAHSVGPGLVTVNDLAVLFRILLTDSVLLVLVWVHRVTYFVEVCERFAFDTSGESRSTFRDGTCRWALFHVHELTLAHLLVRASVEGLSWSLHLRVGSRLAHDILARVLVWITQSVAGELAEGLSGSRALAPVDGHALVEADLVTFLAEGLVASARVAHSQTDRHREKSVTLLVSLEVLLASEFCSVELVLCRVVELVSG